MKRFLVLLVAVATLLCSFSLGVNAAEEWFSDKEPVTDYAFSFAVVGDTQYVTQLFPDKLPVIYDWILDNREEKKIEFVFGMGDITQNGGDEQWATAKESIERMNGVVPYSVIRGNHDDSSMFNRYLATDFYLGEQDGLFREGKIDNTYRTFSVCGNDFLLVNLDYGASDRVLNWAAKAIEAHPNHKVIITTHAYLNHDGTTLDQSEPYAPAAEEAHGTINNGDHMWEKLISKHENIFLVLSGHITSYNVLATQTAGDHGNIVTQMLVDTQGLDKKEPAGNVVMLYFSNDGETVSIEQYSPIRKLYFMYDSQREITVPKFSTEESPVVETTEAATEESTAEIPVESVAGSETETEPYGDWDGCNLTLAPSGVIAIVTSVLPIACALRKKRGRRS